MHRKKQQIQSEKKYKTKVASCSMFSIVCNIWCFGNVRNELKIVTVILHTTEQLLSYCLNLGSLDTNVINNEVR